MFRFLKTAILAGVPFGLFMGLYFVYQTNLRMGTLQGLGAGIFGGVGFASFSQWQRSRFTRKDDQLDGEPLLKQGPANHFLGNESVGGFLYLTDHRLVFRSHKFNVQNHDLHIHLGSIAEVRAVLTAGFIPNGLLVKTEDGEDRFVVQGRGSWVEAIQAAIPEGPRCP